MKAPMAPHKEQDGWVYVRVWRESKPRVVRGRLRHILRGPDSARAGEYSDNVPGSRIISSRRVEEAVETSDYLRRCADEGLTAQHGDAHRPGEGSWYVWSPANYLTWPQRCGKAPTLREAYWRYKNAVAK